jgi:hypothetical protein
MTDTHEQELAKRAQEVVKRYAAAHKAALAKVAHHLGLAKAAHAKGMTSLKKAVGCMVEAKKLGKAADMEGIASNIAAAHDHFNTAASSMDDMEAHLGKAMSGFGAGTAVDADTEVGGGISIPGLSDLTEGEVPWYDSAAPYGEKLAKFKEFVKAAFGVELPDPVKKPVAQRSTDFVSRADAEAMAKVAAEQATLRAENDALKRQVETLSRLPTGAPRVKIFDTAAKSPLPGMLGDTGEGDETNEVRLAKMLNGVDLDIKNEGDFTKASSLMIANMIKNGPKFGKTTFGKAPMWDPGFHGRGGTGARN